MKTKMKELATLIVAVSAAAGRLWAGDAAPSAGQRKDFRLPTESKWIAPRAVVDAARGLILATAEVPAKPERVFDLFTTKEIERWWQAPGYYHWEDFQSDLRVQGQWSVMVRFDSGDANKGWGEYCLIERPHRL